MENKCLGNTLNQKKIKRIAMYVIYDPDGELDDFRKFYLQELRKVTDYIVVIVSGIITPKSRNELEYIADEILVRENKGLLAGSWLDGIKFIGWDVLKNYDELLMLNDSFFGPFYPLKNMFEKMEQSDADFYGAFQNFEDKNIKEIDGRSLKHGYFRGSICYFYIIKSRLLHSPEFKLYWSKKPKINGDWDAIFFNEVDFFDYVLDAGFKIDAYQGDKLKGYFFDNLTHNTYKLVKDEKIPFARIRPFGTNMMDQRLQINYGKDTRQLLGYIDKNTDYDIDFIWKFLLRTKNLTNIYNEFQLEYVVPRDILTIPYHYDKKIAVILHIYYEDLIENMADYCLNFPANTDFYVSVTKDENCDKVRKEFKKRNLSFKCTVRPNVGMAMSTLWVTYRSIVLDGKYEYICYFHDKKSPYGQYSIHGEQFAKRCYDNLFGSEQIVKNIINLFENNPRMGILGAALVYHGNYFIEAQRGWKSNYLLTKKMAEKLELHVNIDPDIVPVAPYGDMFWFRSKALQKVINKKLDYNFFDIEYHSDGTILHAIERLYGFAAQDSGYYYADVINSDDARSDLVNYRYMILSLCKIMIENGHDPYNFEAMKEIARHYKGQYMGFRMFCKQKVKNKVPLWFWNIGKRIYMWLK